MNKMWKDLVRESDALEMNSELSKGKHFEVQFSVRIREYSQFFNNRAIQDIIATIILSLKLAKELFEQSWPITSLELSINDGILLLTRVLVLTATGGLSTVFTSPELKCVLLNRMFWILSIEATKNVST